MLEYQFFVNALIGVALIAVAASLVGTYIVARRMVAVSGGITHACFGGLGLGCYLGLPPMAVAGVFAVASALGVEWLSTRQKLREDSAIAVVWAVGMALGVLFVFLTPGFVPELNSFLSVTYSPYPPPTCGFSPDFWCCCRAMWPGATG